MVRFPEAIKRLYTRVFVCRGCKKKTKATVANIIGKKMVCKKCGGKAFRPIKKQKATIGK
jgi:rRNA maturation endonuclease Nob1